jgi:hypothetical protein
MPSEAKNQLTHLSKKSKTQMLALWKQLFEVPPPREARRDLFVRVLAYKIQEKAYGGLSRETRGRLAALARKLATNPNANLSGTPRIKAGARLIRDWRGQSHRVTVLENGYEYAGKRYSNLSQIARLITGTRWSGPLFFGLKGGRAKERLDGRPS